MGHSIHHATYPENVNKQMVQAEWDDYAAHEDWQEGCSGLGSIRWIDHICDTLEETEEYIRTHDKGWYYQLAVKFRDTGAVPSTSTKKENLLKIIASYKEKKQTFDTVHSLSNLKSEFISCQYCKSKLSRKHIGRNSSSTRSEGCPVCGASDIRADYILDQLSSFQDKIDKWNRQLKEENRFLTRKAAAKAKIRWLLKIEYHT